MKTKRSKATDIPMSVKKRVWERDNCCCVICGDMFLHTQKKYAF